MCKKDSTSNTLWTKDFTKITLASVISMIGGEAMWMPMTLLVYDQTQSTLLSSVLMVCSMLPDIVLSVAVSPVIDRTSKKKWIVGLDIGFFLAYAGMAYYAYAFPFHYAVYIVFTLLTGTLSVFYRLAYDAWYPDLVPVGLEQKGFAVSGMVTDSVGIIMSPVATLLYVYVPMYLLYAFMCVTLVLAIFIEAQIREERKPPKESKQGAFRQYLADLKAGFSYLRKEKGVRNIFTYMSTTFGTGDGKFVLERTYFQTAAHLNVTMYGFTTSVATAARVLSGFFLYKKEVPVKKRFGVVRFVYASLNVLSGVCLFLPYPLMLVNHALQGGLANTSYTLRETATKSYIPADMRARLGAIFNMMVCLSGIGFTLFAGVLGEVMSLRYSILILCAIDMAVMLLFIYLPHRHTRVVYEAVRQEE